jgi:hypothetical protein
MDEIIPQIQEDIPEGEFGEIVSELSLESVIEEEHNQDEDSDEDEVSPTDTDRIGPVDLTTLYQQLTGQILTWFDRHT